MARNQFIGFAFALSVVLGASQAAAYVDCDHCSCSISCMTQCVSDTGFSTCGTEGYCRESSLCDVGSCLTASDPSLFDKLRQQPVRTTTAEHERGKVAARLIWRLAQQVDEAGLGEVYAAEAGFLLSVDGKVQTPDLAFVSHERLKKAAGSRNGVRMGAPDLVAEIPSGPVSSPAFKAKVRDWLIAGTRAVLVVDTGARTLTVYRGRSAVQTYRAGDLLELSDVVPGWALRVGDLFE